MIQRSPVPAPAVRAGGLPRAVADLAAELDELENHESHDVQAILAEHGRVIHGDSGSRRGPAPRMAGAVGTDS